MMIANPGAETRANPGFITRLREDTLQGMSRRRMLMAYLFLIPTMLGIFIFTAGPVMVSLTMSLFKWDVFTAPEFIGTANYAKLFASRQVMTGFGNTLKFVFMYTVLLNGLALFLALALERPMNRFLRYYFRTAFFLPLLLSAAAVSVAFGYLFHREFGVVNYYLSFLGVSRIAWLNSKDWVMYTIVLTAVWRNLGFTFIVYLGGVSTMAKEVLEAADVDGARGFARLRHITIPLLSPTLLFAIVTTIIGGIQVFEEPYIMTRGGPGDASRTAVMVLYEAAFKNIQLGYGSAIAVVLFALILTVTIAQFWLSRRWVFYQ